MDLREDPGDLLETETEVAPLARRVLDDGGYPFRFGEGDVDRFGDPVQAVILRGDPEVTPRVEVEKGDAERLTAAHLRDEGRPGFGKRASLSG